MIVCGGRMLGRAGLALMVIVIGIGIGRVPGALAASPPPLEAAAPTVEITELGSPWVNLTSVAGNVSSMVAPQTEAAKPLSLAAANLGDDAALELIAGYATASGGLLARYADVTGGGAPQFVSLPCAPDFLGVGDFDADGYQDVVAASRGGEALWFLPGDGAGALGRPAPVALPGTLTALAVGELYRQDGIADLAVGVDTPEGARLLVFVGPQGVQASEPEVFPLPARVTALAMGQLDDAYPFDLALIAGDALTILHGHDQVISGVDAPAFEVFPLTFAPVSLAIGDFRSNDGQIPEIALLAENGEVHLLDRSGAAIGGTSVAVQGPATLLRAHVSSLNADDLLVVDAAGRQVEIVTLDGQRMTPEGNVEQAVRPGALAMLSTETGAVAALPVHLNDDPFEDLVLLTEGAFAPVPLVATVVHTFVVDSPGDQPDSNPGNGKCEVVLLSGSKVCTLRAAIQEANAGTGADDIQLDIPRGFWSTDSILLSSALPDVTETVWIRDVVAGSMQIIDGRNVPVGIGLHIKTFNVWLDDLAFVSFVNANPAIKISVSGENSIRNCQIGPSNGGVGVELASGVNRIHGTVIAGNATGVRVTGGSGNIVGPANYIGFGSSGTGPTNNTGIEVAGATNTQIGDADPPAGVSAGRNVISGNRVSGIRLTDTTTNGTLIVKNTIGLNAAGTQALGNGGRGILIVNGAAATTIGVDTDAGRNLIGANALGIEIDHAFASADTLIQGNFIGVNADASAAIANTTAGIRVDAPSVVQILHNVIGGSPTSDDGIRLEYFIQRTLAHIISYNHIGTNLAGTADLGNGKNGIATDNLLGVQMTNNVIRNNGQSGIDTWRGGQFTITSNMISGNHAHGIYLVGSSSTLTGNSVGVNGVTHSGILVAGNDNTLRNNTVYNDIQSLQIGVSLLGSGNTLTNDLSEEIRGGSYGVMMSGDSNTLSGYVVRDAATGVLVSGTSNTIGIGNRIHGNIIGIAVDGTAIGTIVRGNMLGVDATGNATAPNYEAGITIAGTTTTIGGSSAADGNVISGGAVYLADGVRIIGGSGATVRNNKIGVGLNGTTALGNLYGIRILGGTQSTIRDNTIAYNGTGVLIEQGTGHAIVGNSIRGNTALGIDLSPAGVTLNDTGDGDTGGNALQNYPVITLAGIVATGTRVQGMLDSLPSRTYTIRLYSNPTCDPSGHGEGQTYLGQGTVATNAGGQANIDLTVGTAATAGHFLAVTATDPDGNTSEFSACSGPLGVLGAAVLTVNTAGDATDTNTADGICDSSGDSGEQCTLRAAIQQANATAGANTILVPAGVYPLTIVGAGGIEAGDLDISGELTISGAGANVTTIQGQMADRVFDLLANAIVTISGVTVKGGSVAAGDGGGVRVASTAALTMDGVSVQENTATSGSGGGIYTSGGLTLSDCAVISNTAGIETNGGGGIYLYLGTATLRNTTLSGNQTRGNGGGIFNLLGTAYLNNVTVTGNTADSDNDGGDGGGLWNSSTFYAKNSVIAANTDLSHAPYHDGVADCYGTYTSQSYNLIGDQARTSNTSTPACQGFSSATNDSVGGSWLNTLYLTYGAGLGPLQLNGGTTLNHSPYSYVAGATVDFGNPAAPGSGGNACEAIDQRGQARPIDGGTDGVARCDRGAVEHIPSYLSIGDVTVTEGGTATFNVTLSAPAQITFTVQYSTTAITAIAGRTTPTSPAPSPSGPDRPPKQSW